MIKEMRDMAPTIMLVILIAFVGGTIFLDWGMNFTGGKSKMTNAGEVNGKEIPLTYFDNQVNTERQRMQEGGQEIPPQQYRMVPQQVWEKEVNRVLVMDVIKKMKLSATADEVFEYIKNNPLPGIDTASIFQTEGKFDTSKYVDFLNRPENYEYHRWLRDIEAYAREVIIPSQKLEQLLGAVAQPTKAEIEYQYRQEHEKAIFEYAKVNALAFEVDSSLITDAMIKNYYAGHRDSFNQDAQVELLYVKFPKVATAQDEQVYLQELLELRNRVAEKQSTFEDEAKVESDDQGSAQNGGDLGWFGRGAMVPEFDSVAFTITPGIISEPIKTQFGYHLILVEKREMQDGEMKVKARHILRKIAPTMETLDLLAEKVDSLRIRMLETDFAQAAREDSSVVLDSTGLFKKGDFLPGVGYVSGVMSFAFGKDKGQISERMENTESMFLFSPKRSIKKGIVPLDIARSQIVKALTDSLRNRNAKEYAEQLVRKIQSSTPLAHLQDTDSLLSSGVTDTISRTDYIPAIGFNTKAAAVAFSLPIGKASGLIDDNGSYYVVRPLWKNTVDNVPWESPDVEQVRNNLAMQEQQRRYYDWYLSYKQDAKIKSNVNDLYVD